MVTRFASLAAFAAAFMTCVFSPGYGPSPFAVSPAHAAPEPAMFLKIAGIEGESTVKGHAKEIEILSWSWGMSSSGSARTGGGGGAGKVTGQDLSLAKSIDKATPQLMRAVATGKHFPDAVLTVRRSGERPVEYLVITMQDVVVTSYAAGEGGGSGRTENVMLNFAKVKVAYTPQNPDGSAGSPVIFGWDFAQNREF